MADHDGTNLQDFVALGPSSLGFSPSSLFDLHLKPELDSLDHAGFLGGWPSSTAPHDLYYSSYTAAKMGANQDSWNPLLAAGLPRETSIPHFQMPAVGDPDFAFTESQHTAPSESGSQYLSSLHSDSGYASTDGAAHSVVPSTFGADSLSSPQMDANEHLYGSMMPPFGTSHAPAEAVATQNCATLPFEDSVKCSHPTCSWVGKCPSDKRYIMISTNTHPQQQQCVSVSN